MVANKPSFRIIVHYIFDHPVVPLTHFSFPTRVEDLGDGYHPMQSNLTRRAHCGHMMERQISMYVSFLE